MSGIWLGWARWEVRADGRLRDVASAMGGMGQLLRGSRLDIAQPLLPMIGGERHVAGDVRLRDAASGKTNPTVVQTLD